jgi:hypothetical protein
VRVFSEKHINGTTININNMNKEAVAKPGTRQIIKDMGIRKIMLRVICVLK